MPALKTAIARDERALLLIFRPQQPIRPIPQPMFLLGEIDGVWRGESERLIIGEFPWIDEFEFGSDEMWIGLFGGPLSLDFPGAEGGETIMAFLLIRRPDVDRSQWWVADQKGLVINFRPVQVRSKIGVNWNHPRYIRAPFC